MMPSLPPIRLFVPCHFLFMIMTGIVLSGCGSSATGPKLDRHVVEGTVTLDGNPVDNGQIQFFSTIEGESPTASGTIISNGKYKLPEEGGLVPGVYKVSISASPVSPPLPDDPNAAMEAASKAKPPVELVPAKYNSKSTLTCDVAQDGRTTANFELSSK